MTISTVNIRGDSSVSVVPYDGEMMPSAVVETLCGYGIALMVCRPNLQARANDLNCHIGCDFILCISQNLVTGFRWIQLEPKRHCQYGCGPAPHRRLRVATLAVEPQSPHAIGSRPRVISQIPRRTIDVRRIPCGRNLREGLRKGRIGIAAHVVNSFIFFQHLAKQIH